LPGETLATISKIAENPSKALGELEKELGVEPGALLREMEQFSEQVGDWTQHLPYGLAVCYYNDRKVQVQYEPHVDDCGYCQRLLDTLHPSKVQAKDFAKSAVRAQPRKQHGSKFGRYGLPVACAALVVALASAAFAVPALQLAGFLPIPDHKKSLAILFGELGTQPGRLVRLETSEDPSDRYQAARVYFAADKPQLAWQQIGQGLELAGVHPIDAEKITTAADVPTHKSAQTLVAAAKRLSFLKANTSENDPTLYLERAELEAKLGLNSDALKSIQLYLEARKIDPKALADFSEAALTELPKLTDAAAMAQPDK
jgi:hypothetical protein